MLDKSTLKTKQNKKGGNKYIRYLKKNLFKVNYGAANYYFIIN